MNVFFRNLKAAKGFSLVELGIVLVIIGIISTWSLQTFTTQRTSAMLNDSQQRLSQIKATLMSFVAVNGYLPCPDTNSPGDAAYGTENRSGNQCSASIGTVPFKTLNFSQIDAHDGYNHPIRYAVNQDVNTTDIDDPDTSASYFSIDAPPKFDLETPPTSSDPGTDNLHVCSAQETSCSATGSDYTAFNQSVVLVAYNFNGKTAQSNCSSLDAGERENCDSDALYWHQTYQDNDSVFFDDLMVSISAYEIKNQRLRADPSSLRP